MIAHVLIYPGQLESAKDAGLNILFKGELILLVNKQKTKILRATGTLDQYEVFLRLLKLLR